MGWGVFAGFVAVASLSGFCLMWYDKTCARRRERRIPEKTLFTVAFFLGSPGILAGMYAFRHKTRHLKFVLGIPLILILQAAAVWGIAYLLG